MASTTATTPVDLASSSSEMASTAVMDPHSFLLKHQPGPNPLNVEILTVAQKLFREAEVQDRKLNETKQELARSKVEVKRLKDALTACKSDQDTLEAKVKKIIDSLPPGKDIDPEMKVDLIKMANQDSNGTIRGLEDLFRKMVELLRAYQKSSQQLIINTEKKELELLKLRRESGKASTATAQADGLRRVPVPEVDIEILHQALKCLSYCVEESLGDMLDDYVKKRDMLPQPSETAAKAQLLDPVKNALIRYLRCVVVLKETPRISLVEYHFTKDFLKHWSDTDDIIKSVVVWQENQIKLDTKADEKMWAERWLHQVNMDLPQEAVAVICEQGRTSSHS